MKNRNDLAKWFAEMGFNKGVEVGVDRGVFSEILCQANPDLELTCVDKWDIGEGPNPRRETHYLQAQEKLKPYNVKLWRQTSCEAVGNFPYNSLDFVYIDADHSFDGVMEDIIEWGKCVKKGGVIAGHDYGNGNHVGVKDAVNIYAKHHQYVVKVLPEPDIYWEPRHPSDEIAGLTWYMVKRWNS